MFLYHVESCFKELLDPRFAHVWKLIGQEQPSDAVCVWSWCLCVVDAFASSKDPDPSIEKIYQNMLGAAKRSMSPGGDLRISSVEKKHTLQAIFAVLCWLSATLEPLIGSNVPKISYSPSHPEAPNEEGRLLPESTTLFARHCSRTYSSSNLRRPTSLLFNMFRLQPSTTVGLEGGSNETNLQAAGNSFEDMLYEPNLTYSSLRMFGHVRIKWVDTLTAHLSFNYTTRELSVYRYPSFCVAKILSEQPVEILERYYCNNPNPNPQPLPIP